MKRAAIFTAVVVALGAGCSSPERDMRAGLGLACEDDEPDAGPETSIGRKCFISDEDFDLASRVYVPALECSSRLCLYYPDGVPGWGQPAHDALCTAECDSDSDCDPTPESPCATRMTCDVATTTGPWAGRHLCICEQV
jgi:hypothetical protein